MIPLVLTYGDVILRDRIPADITDHRRWLTTEMAWLEWDAPWEKIDEHWVRKYLQRLEENLRRPLPPVRSTLEICHRDGTHIGMVNAYYIDSDKEKPAVGITLRESMYWGRGLGSQAFPLWVDYLFRVGGYPRLYCQTWSGNARMIRLAEKCGFREIQRLVNCREVQGRRYDALTFALPRCRFTGLPILDRR